MIKIFNFFKRKSHIENTMTIKENTQKDCEMRTVLEEGQESLKEIEKRLCQMKDHKVFVRLLSFVAYYSFIIEFYKGNIEQIISVKELLLLKYIHMIKDILNNFHEESALKTQKEELLETLRTINEKLYATIKNIKEQQELDLKVDLKTIQDLIQSDF
ncbi:hypothetical protein [Crassaminicella profunda]|uniref:hypothetical protein n=1 Tax=Crassaminicella profunda TaxID=1286698 RepID=UPI001CA618DD|nr:hypothetical protein [Crassaminicella profunda]QZY55435.1 hypothetical protein K7H06_20975 [Crassaminicella profunda]